LHLYHLEEVSNCPKPIEKGKESIFIESVDNQPNFLVVQEKFYRVQSVCLVWRDGI
jgi:hypothetical protein